jgi:4-hydroxy-tetrahydrodipicolinate synthase
MANKAIQGVIVPAVTPLLDGGGLDRSGLYRLVDRLASAGVHGAMVAGTTGEALALSREVRSDLIRESAAALREAGMVSVAGIGGSCLEDILHFARVASDSGVSFLSLHPPPYFPVAGDALEGVYRAVLEEADVPLLLYTIPSFAGNVLPVELAERLAREPMVAGLKDSTGDLAYFREVLARCGGPGFSLLMGSESLMVQGYEAGGDGMVPSIGNLHPALCMALHERAVAGDHEGAMEIQEQLNAIVRPVLQAGSWIGMIRWMKAALAAEGIGGGALAPLFMARPAAQGVRA